MISDKLTKKIVLQSRLVTPGKLRNISNYAKKEGLTLEQALIEKEGLSEEDLYRQFAALYDLPFVDLGKKVIRKDILFLVPEPIASGHQVIAFDKKDEAILLATTEPEDLQTFEFIGRKARLPVKVYITVPSAIASALKSYKQSLKAEFKEITSVVKKDKGEEKDLKKLAEDIPIIRIVDSMLEHAMYENASDIHVEPGEKELVIRYRIDGILRPVMTMPAAAQDGIVARVKILSNLKLDEHRLPQDGRFKVETNEFKYSIRVSILPVYDGEKVVMRLLPETAKALTLEQLGFLKGPKQLVEKAISRPHGIIYATGPTGSGKTTTLYSLLSILNKPGVNIVTIEDPIEYHLPGINQSQVRSNLGYTFATGLRSILRQDPNIIMVGEIRDTETASIAANAALTGHLVLSTMHTNDAPTAMPRLADLEVPAFLIAYTTNLVIAQRLVRKVCQNCAKSYTISASEIKELQNSSDRDVKMLLRDVVKAGELPANVRLESLSLKRGNGCRKCNNEGYKGRIGIYEVLTVSPALSALIAKGANAHQIRQQASADGMLTMLQDGLVKAALGVTTLEEVFRVTRE